MQAFCDFLAPYALTAFMHTCADYGALLVSFIVYLAIILVIGLFAHHQRSPTKAGAQASDFILGGRSTHWFLTALSAHAADMSDWLFMGFPAAVYLAGGFSLWIPIGLLIGMFLTWHFVAARLRIESERHHGVTLASFLSNRFNDRSGMLSLVAAVISLFFFVIYLSVGLKGMGFVLKSAFHLNYHVGIALSMAVVIIYTFVGGFTSVALIDLFQGIFLLAMVMVVPAYAYFTVGGLTPIMAAAAQRHVSLSLIADFDWRSLASIVLDPLAWGLGYFGMPHILTKFMGTKNANELYKGKYVGLIWQLLAMASAAAVGIVGLAYFVQGVPDKPEFIFIAMAQGLFNPWIAGWVLCAILAATISTVDTQMLVVAGIVTHDLYRKIFRPHAAERELKRIYRAGLILAAIGGFIIAWDEQSTIMALVRYAWAGLGASFGPLVLLALYTKNINAYGAIAGMLAGCLTAVSWDLIAPFVTTVSVYAMVPAYAANILSAILVSRLTSK